ncbi:aspartate/glutamate racemase family protein [Pseudomonas abieticivorans]|uniref:aspartate/glutamate racemase family protein n=1 Tax=Pseudomonas abieticivorans TaxID=2931382 RepID=UPI0020BD75A4|nr:aspartate/glutamate racemase family protein [Pseudomonas sp. PIA16]
MAGAYLPTDLSRSDYVARPRLGIITGSGPEAGMDMWAKLLGENRRRLGAAFRGDLDAPALTIVSDPELGLSMELEKTEEQVWQALRDDIYALNGRVSAFSIACNTLNLFAERIRGLDLQSEFISFYDVLQAHLHKAGTQRICLLGARPVAELGIWSPYRGLVDIVECEAVPAAEQLHQLIYDIKALGAGHSSLRPRFAELLAGIQADTVLLACTELPLIADIATDKTLVDVTQLVVEAMLDHTGLKTKENGQ